MRKKNNVVTAEVKNRVLAMKLKKRFSSGECVMRLSTFHEETFFRFLVLYARKNKNVTRVKRKAQSYVNNTTLFVSFLSPDPFFS